MHCNTVSGSVFSPLSLNFKVSVFLVLIRPFQTVLNNNKLLPYTLTRSAD